MIVLQYGVNILKMNIMKRTSWLSGIFLLLTGLFTATIAQSVKGNSEMDAKVKQFLADARWRDLNVPHADGQLLHDLIIKGNYKHALEIGTSTGLSGIYIAWALSKTGGKLITIEIDEQRHKTAVENFRRVGLSEFIDARLADAHVLVKELQGPFDFVFSDADKDWYKNYFLDVDPKLKVGGCYTTHNISERRGPGGGSGEMSYLDFIRSLPHYESSLDTRGAGMLISYKRANP